MTSYSAITDTSADPLAKCLLVVAKWHGISTTIPALTSGLPLVDSMLTPQLVPRAAKRIGLTSRMVKSSPADVPPGLLPVILIGPGNKACVLLSRKPASGLCEVVYPELHEAKTTVPIEELREAYPAPGIVLRPRFRFDARAPSRTNATDRHWFWGVILENAPVYRDVLLAALLINLFALATPLFVMNVYDRVVPNFAIETLWALAIGMLLIIVADVILRTIRGYFLDIASQRADVKISSSIMEKLLGLRLEVRPVSAGSFAANLRSFEMVRDFFTSATITSVIDLPFALLFAALIAWLAWPLVIPLVIAATIIVSYSVLISRRMRALAETTYNAGAQRNATLVETLVGLDTLKALGAEGHIQRRWERTSSFLARVSVQLRLVAASNAHVAVWVQQTAYVAVIVGGVYLVADARLSLGGLIACSILTSRALSPFSQLAGLITQYHNAAAAMKSLNTIMDQPVERPPGSRFLSREHFSGDIEFKNVSFTYPHSDVETIRDFSLKIAPGEHVCILGRIGSGKTTIQRLAMGLYQPTSGAVLIDGIDLRQLDTAELRHAVGYAPQEVTLFYGTLRENLLMAQPQVEDQDLIRAVEIAGLSSFVKTHPQGLDMPIGERGDSLSGGQRKAVALARALVHDPNVILLDEPTGSMDFSTEKQVKQNLKSYCAGKTLIMITHHTSLLELVGRIVVMDNGRIVADGPKEQVVEALKKGRIGSAR